MSGRVTGTVLRFSRSKGTTRLVAVVIADSCRDDGTSAWPGIRTIAERAGTSVRSVQRSIKKLVQLNELDVFENQGPHRTNLYAVKIDRLLAYGDRLTGATNCTAAGCQNPTRHGDKTVSPDPSGRSSVQKQVRLIAKSEKSNTGNGSRYRDAGEALRLLREGSGK